MGLKRLAGRALDGAWRLSRNARLAFLRRAAASQVERPNSASEWSALYPEKNEIIRDVQSPVARAFNFELMYEQPHLDAVRITSCLSFCLFKAIQLRETPTPGVHRVSLSLYSGTSKR